MSLGVPGPRSTIDQRIGPTPLKRMTIDPSDSTVRRIPLHEALAEAGMDSLYCEASPGMKKVDAASKKEEASKDKDEEGTDPNGSTRPRSLLKRMFGAR